MSGPTRFNARLATVGVTTLPSVFRLLRVLFFSAVLAAMFLNVDLGTPASASHEIRLSTLQAPNKPGRGMAFDGDHLYFTAHGLNKIYKMDAAGNVLAELPTSVNFWALTWDGEQLWGTDAAVTSTSQTIEQFYTIDRNTGSSTFRFEVNLTGQLAPCPPGDRTVDGLAYDFNTGTFWASEDLGATVFNISPTTGQVIRQVFLGFNTCNSGVATDGDSLWLFTCEYGFCSGTGALIAIEQWSMNGTFMDTILLSGFHGDVFHEDMEWDPISFRHLSKCALWATSGWVGSPSVEIIRAYSVPCPSSGYPEGHYGNESSRGQEWSDDPVNVVFGNFNHQQTDISIPTRGLPLEFTRTYSSAASAVDGSLGFGWTHNYNMHLEFEAGGSVIVVHPDGRRDRYLALPPPAPPGTYLPPPDFFDTLFESGGDYTLTTVNQTKYVFDSQGKLQSIADRNNNTNTLDYYTSGPDIGRLWKVSDPTPSPNTRSLTFTYTASGLVFQVTDPLGRVLEFGYDGSGNLTTVKDINTPTGTTTFTYTSAHLLETVTDSNGHLATLNCYDSSDRVYKQFGPPPAATSPVPTCSTTRATAGDVPITEFFYNTPGVGQTTLRDPRNNATIYKFDNLFRVTKITDALGGVTEYTYDSNSNRTCVKDPLGNRTAYSYDDRGNVTQMVDAQHADASCNLKPPPDDKAWTYTYNLTNDILTETDPLNHQTEYRYDSVSTGNLTRVIRWDAPGGNIKSLTCFEYHDGTAPGRQTAIVKSTDLVPGSDTADCTGNRTKFEYNDDYDNLTATINPESIDTPPPKTTFVVDAGGRTTSVTNELSHTTAYDYDERGALRSTTDNLGNSTSFTYDAKGNLETVRDANRKIAGNESETDSNGCGPLGTGDGLDNDTTPTDDDIVDDGCPSTKYEYDRGDRLRRVIDVVGNVTEYRYDVNGNRTDIILPNRQPLNTAETGQTGCGALGVGDYEDDDPVDDGNPVPPVKDDGCPSVRYEYDALNRLVSEIRPGSAAPGCVSPPDCVAVTRYQYDAVGNRTAVADAKHAAYQAPETGVGVGQPCGESGSGDGIDNDAGGADGFVDDGCPGNLYRFDALNRLERVEHWAGTVLLDAVDYTFDLAGNRDTMTDSTGLTDYGYDALNRLTVITTPAVTAPGCTTQPHCLKTVAYEYDDLPGGAAADYPGERTKITYPDGKVVTYTYYKDGRMKTVTDWLSKTTQYNYNNARFLSSSSFPSPAGSVTYAYDNADRTSQVTHQTVATESFTYLRDAIGNVTQVTRTNEQPEKYTYDPLQRLESVQYPDTQAVSYTYDGNGNRKTLNNSTSGLLNYSYDPADQLTQAGGTAYSYDANGNLATRGNEAYYYDQENRLTKITFDGYDPFASAVPVNITSSSAAFPTVITASSAHGMSTGDNVLIRGHTGSNPDINGEWTITVVNSTTFRIPVNVTVGGSGGTTLRKRPCYDFVGDTSNGTGQGYVSLQDLGSFVTPANAKKFGTSPGDPNYDPYWDTYPGGGISLQDLGRLVAPAAEAPFNRHCPRRFTYNGDGIRVGQTLGRFATDYVWDPGAGTPMVLQETNREDLLRYSSDPNDTAIYRTRSEYTYVYGLGLISITDAQGNQSYALPDALGSVRTLSNGADGSPYATYSYEPFGTPRLQEGPHTTFRFAGEQYDLKARQQGGVISGTNGLYYLRARYYDPTIGRFLTRDPLPGSARDPSFPEGLNAYAYVQNNPVNRVDPTGMLTEDCPTSLDLTASCILDCFCDAGIGPANYALCGTWVAVTATVCGICLLSYNPTFCYPCALLAFATGVRALSCAIACDEPQPPR